MGIKRQRAAFGGFKATELDNGNWTVEKVGGELCPFEFKYVRNYQDGFIEVKFLDDGKWGFMDLNWKVSKGRWDDVSSFNGVYAIAYTNGVGRNVMRYELNQKDDSFRIEPQSASL